MPGAKGKSGGKAPPKAKKTAGRKKTNSGQFGTKQGKKSKSTKAKAKASSGSLPPWMKYKS